MQLLELLFPKHWEYEYSLRLLSAWTSIPTLPLALWTSSPVAGVWLEAVVTRWPQCGNCPGCMEVLCGLHGAVLGENAALRALKRSATMRHTQCSVYWLCYNKVTLVPPQRQGLTLALSAPWQLGSIQPAPIGSLPWLPQRGSPTSARHSRPSPSSPVTIRSLCSSCCLKSASSPLTSLQILSSVKVRHGVKMCPVSPWLCCGL